MILPGAVIRQVIPHQVIRMVILPGDPVHCSAAQT